MCSAWQKKKDAIKHQASKKNSDPSDHRPMCVALCCFEITFRRSTSKVCSLLFCSAGFAAGHITSTSIGFQHKHIQEKKEEEEEEVVLSALRRTLSLTYFSTQHESPRPHLRLSRCRCRRVVPAVHRHASHRVTLCQNCPRRSLCRSWRALGQ